MADFNGMGAITAFTAGRAYRNAKEDRQREQGLQNTQAKAQAALMSGDANAARELAMGSNDAATMQAVQAQLGQMNEQQRQAARERVQGLGAAAYSLAQIPAEQRSQWVMQNGQSLAGLGINPQQIAQMDLSDQNLSAFIRQAEAMQAEFFAPYTLGENEARFTVSGGEQLNPNAALNRGVDQARLAETVRSNRADEGIARQGVAIDQFQADTGRMAEMRQQQGAPQARRTEQFGQERQLRGEFQDITADFREIADQYNVLTTSAQQHNAQGDLALIVAFTKLLDPGSVAREGEVSLSQSTASVVQQSGNWLRRLQAGNTLLPDEVRQAFVSAAGELASQYEDSFSRRQQEYTQLSDQYGLNADRVIVGGASLNRPEESAPPPADSEPVQLPTDAAAARRAYADLPSGAVFVTPSGETRRKP